MKRAGKTHINQQGFTMIEVIMVLIVLSIVGAVIAYRPTMGSNEIAVQAEILKSHLRYAQIKAMNDTVPWGIRIPNANSYILYEEGTDPASDILPGETAQTHTLPNVVTITSGVGSTYKFNELGTPVDAGGTPMALSQTITFTQTGTPPSPITITRNTGYIP